MSCVRFLLLLSLIAPSLTAKDLCTCTYTGYAGDKCGNNPSATVAFPTMTEGQCVTLTGFQETYFDLEGVTFAGTSISDILCNVTSTGSSGTSSGTASSNSTSNNATSSSPTNGTSNATSGTSNATDTTSTSNTSCPGSSAIVDYGSYTVDSCQGNEASVTFYQGTSCAGSGFQITLTKGKCTKLVEVLDLGWFSYQLKCNRGGSSNNNGDLGLHSSISVTVGMLLLFLTAL